MGLFPGNQSSKVDSAPKGLNTKPPAAEMPGAGKGSAANFGGGDKNRPSSTPKGLKK